MASWSMEPSTEDPNIVHVTNTVESTHAQPLATKKRKFRTKRHKADTILTTTPTSEPLGPCLLSQLPLELLAEILIHTCSPKDVLAVARTSKYFCGTLLSPPSMFIWRSVRRACLPHPLPDPITIFTESSYASFLFDGGPCEICDTPTDSMYKSFAIRLRLCNKRECTTKFLEMAAAPTNSELDQVIGTLVPYVESDEPLKRVNVSFHHLRRVFRGIDWVREGSQYSSLPPQEIRTLNATKIKHVSALMKFSKNLRDWEVSYGKLYLRIKDSNEVFGKALAEHYGWQYWDMLNCTPYGELHRHKNKTLQYVTQSDYDHLAPAIAEILLKVAEKRQRQSKEAMYKANRSSVSQHYNRLRSKKPPLMLPTLPTFRRLPIVAMVQSSESTSPGAAKILEGPSWTSERLDTELKKWIDQAKGVLGTVLGYPNWRTASTTVLHPVDRATARFLCQYCGRLAVRYRDDECLDFSGACSHECRTSKGQKRRDQTWDAKRFVKDDKAINAISKLAALCAADPAHEECRKKITSTAVWVLCLSCKPEIVMCSKSVVGHSHRHDDMEMTLVTETAAQDILAPYPFKYGAAQDLLETYPTAVKLRALKNYGCRFCLAANRHYSTEDLPEIGSPPSGAKTAVISNLTEETDVSETRNVKPYRRSYTFDGMRSHLKAVHNIEHIRSEDFFSYNLLNGGWGSP